MLRSGWLTYGRASQEFEEHLARYLRAKGAVFNSSGTAALHVALLAAGVSVGDEVITTPLSYVATSNVILYVGAKPVFVDVDPQTGILDLEKVEEAISPKTRAIIPVHLYGQMVDMKRLKQIADAGRLKIIEDAAHALESERDGVKPGELSFAACFSFHVAKNITSGEGGAVVVRDKSIAEQVRLLCEGGVSKKDGKRRMVSFGFKYSNTDFQAALLLNQLRRVEHQHSKRKKRWEYYAHKISDVNGVSFPNVLPRTRHGYHMFVVWIDPGKRDAIREKLTRAGIQTSIHFDAIHLEPYYQKSFGYRPGDFPVAERLGLSTITLPLYPRLTAREQDYIVKTLSSLV